MKNKGTIIAVLFVVGLFTFGFGLDWDQSQITWKANASNTLMITGGVMAAGSLLWLAASSGWFGNSKN